MWFLVIIIPLFIWLDYHVFRFLYGTIFTNKDDFDDSVRYSFTPDIFSLFKGEYLKDNFAEFKLSLFVLLCIVTIALEVLMTKAIVS